MVFVVNFITRLTALTLSAIPAAQVLGIKEVVEIFGKWNPTEIVSAIAVGAVAAVLAPSPIDRKKTCLTQCKKKR